MGMGSKAMGMVMGSKNHPYG
jgi:hypothetical protein